MWTAFVWGFGVSCGVLSAVFLFAVFYVLFEWATGAAEKKADAYLEALVERNILTEDMVAHMAMIASAARKYAGE